MAKGWHQTEEAKRRIRDKMKGRPAHNKGVPHTEKHKKKISDGLKGKSQSPRFYNLICENCGEEFISGTHNKKYCSACLKRICENCNKEFELTYAELKGSIANGPRKYCSQKCYHKSTIGKEPPNKDYIDMECQFCGNAFQVPRARQNTAKYCCRDCKHNAMSEVTGPAHPLWKGGFDLYGRMLSQNGGSFYRNRVKVLERDDNTCCHCGHQGESNYMDVHHIIPVREHGPSTEDNMLTLCRKCHNQADRGLISRDLLFSYIRPRRVAYQ